MKRPKQDYSIQAVENAFKVLQEFNGERAELGISDLARRLSLHKNAVFRLAATLEALGYVEQNPLTENYRLGVECLELGKAFLRHTGLSQASMGRLEALRDIVGESCYLGILSGYQVFYLEGAQSDHALRVASRIGTRLAAYCTAIGKLLLAHLESEQQAQVLDHLEFQPCTANTLCNKVDLLQQLKQIKAQGYAIDQEEKEIGVVGVAAPLKDHHGKVVAGLSILGPSVRVNAKTLEKKFLPALLATADEISKAMGFQATA